VSQTGGHPDQAVTLATHLPAQPIVGVDCGRDGPGLVEDLPGTHGPTVLVHVDSDLSSKLLCLATFGFRAEFLSQVAPRFADRRRGVGDGVQRVFWRVADKGLGFVGLSEVL
jgi:hypothetical protein